MPKRAQLLRPTTSTRVLKLCQDIQRWIARQRLSRAVTAPGWPIMSFSGYLITPLFLSLQPIGTVTRKKADAALYRTTTILHCPKKVTFRVLSAVPAGTSSLSWRPLWPEEEEPNCQPPLHRATWSYLKEVWLQAAYSRSFSAISVPHRYPTQSRPWLSRFRSNRNERALLRVGAAESEQLSYATSICS